ncbi:unnamed protein product [Blepharisma stoltei]|uniref:B box-type domain-containing protein n=1 Tax=Blepharisma stoltei TaxID=1481888 RepID=A0AAU9INQ1_9CILI|nr:unnamed protein product [Blepharisma stoltei]
MDNNSQTFFSSFFAGKKPKCAHCQEEGSLICFWCKTDICEYHGCKRYIKRKNVAICNHCSYSDLYNSITEKFELMKSEICGDLKKINKENMQLKKEIEINGKLCQSLKEKADMNEYVNNETSRKLMETIRVNELVISGSNQTFRSLAESLERQKQCNLKYKEKINCTNNAIEMVESEIKVISEQKQQAAMHVNTLSKILSSSGPAESIARILCEKCKKRFFGSANLARLSFSESIDKNDQKASCVSCSLL